MFFLSSIVYSPPRLKPYIRTLHNIITLHNGLYISRYICIISAGNWADIETQSEGGRGLTLGPKASRYWMGRINMSTNQEWTRGSSHCPGWSGCNGMQSVRVFVILFFRVYRRIHSVDQAQKPDIYQLLLLLPWSGSIFCGDESAEYVVVHRKLVDSVEDVVAQQEMFRLSWRYFCSSVKDVVAQQEMFRLSWRYFCGSVKDVMAQ